MWRPHPTGQREKPRHLLRLNSPPPRIIQASRDDSGSPSRTPQSDAGLPIVIVDMTFLCCHHSSLMIEWLIDSFLAANQIISRFNPKAHFPAVTSAAPISVLPFNHSPYTSTYTRHSHQHLGSLRCESRSLFISYTIHWLLITYYIYIVKRYNFILQIRLERKATITF
jgi:hypothetical protein